MGAAWRVLCDGAWQLHDQCDCQDAEGHELHRLIAIAQWQMSAHIGTQAEQEEHIEQGHAEQQIAKDDEPLLRFRCHKHNKQHNAQRGKQHSQRFGIVARVVELFGLKDFVRWEGGADDVAIFIQDGALFLLVSAYFPYGFRELVILLRNDQLAHIVHAFFDEEIFLLRHLHRQVITLAEPLAFVGVELEQLTGPQHLQYVGLLVSLQDGALVVVEVLFKFISIPIEVVFVGSIFTINAKCLDCLSLYFDHRLVEPGGRVENKAAEDLFEVHAFVGGLAIELHCEVLGYGLQRADATVIVGVKVAELGSLFCWQRLRSCPGMRGRAKRKNGQKNNGLLLFQCFS